MSDLQWFRVEVDDGGHVVSCRPVESAADNGERVFYIRAAHEDEAGKIAFRVYCRDRLRARREKLAAEGKCDCGRPRDSAHQSCSRCLELHREYKKRSKARRAGQAIPVRDRRETHAQRRQEDVDLLRLSILEEIRDVWKRRGVTGLAVWLRKEIAKLSQERAA